MVEGPGVTLNGERLRKAGVIGHILIAVLGSALQPADVQSLLKLQVTDVVILLAKSEKKNVFRCKKNRILPLHCGSGFISPKSR